MDRGSGIDAPEVVRDLDRMDAECIAFEQDYKGRLAEEAARDGGGAWLAQAVKRYEAIDDLAWLSALIPAWFMPAIASTQRSQNLWRYVRAPDDSLDPSAVLRA